MINGHDFINGLSLQLLVRVVEVIVIANTERQRKRLNSENYNEKGIETNFTAHLFEAQFLVIVKIES